VELTTYVKDEYAHVEVLDSGAGMTEEFIKNQIFKPFTTTKKKGLGIGLYQCKAIMEAHGGNIEASSIPNRGSQFTLKFPVE
jgi:signal transduction histidine kinase